MNAYASFTHDLPQRAARIFLEGDNGERLSYADLERESARVAALLTGLGLKPGDRVAAQIDKSPQGLLLYLGVLRAGLCFLPLNTAYQKSELEYFMQDAEPAVVVCRPDRLELLRQIARQAHVFTLDEAGQGTLRDALAKVQPEFHTVEVSDNDLAAIIYTSGTTGRAKGAMVTHGNLASNGEALRHFWKITEQDVLLHALPLFHVHGLFIALSPTLIAGAKILFLRKFDAGAVLAALPRATLMMGVPTYYTRLLDEPGLTREAVKNMRVFISGSAPLLPETFKAWQQRTGHTLLERYGMSEASVITSSPYDGERRCGSVGLPLPGVALRVAGANGEPGEVQIKGPNVCAGYWRMPEKTGEDYTTDGWFKTGDIGQLSADGYVSIVGRARDLIISGGYNVYPREIELLLDAMPGVAESAVIGVPHRDLGEAVVAVIVRAANSTLSEEQVIAHAKAHIAGFKVPKRVHFVEDLPRNAMGKVQKNVLRDLFAKIKT